MQFYVTGHVKIQSIGMISFCCVTFSKIYNSKCVKTDKNYIHSSVVWLWFGLYGLGWAGSNCLAWAKFLVSLRMAPHMSSL